LLVGPAAVPLAATDRSQAAAVAAAPLVPGIPEPPTYVLMLAGIVAVGYLARRRRRE
jgi:PEP-CTERM motif